MYHSILVPLDGSAFGERALPLALAIARSVGGHLHLTHVHHAHRSPPRRAQRTVDLSPAIVDLPSEQAYLDQVAQRLGSLWDGEITTALLSGPIALALYDHAVEIAAEIIVLTTHGRGPLSRFWRRLRALGPAAGGGLRAPFPRDPGCNVVAAPTYGRSDSAL